jgi:putative phosphoesterase
VNVGVISDTHNYLDPAIPKLFAGVAHILHAGDIGQSRILRDLERIAPVTAVAGNTDDACFHFRPFEVIELAGRKFLVQHIVNPHALTDSFQDRLAAIRPDVVIFGHTHKPFSETIGGILYFNPGYAGKSRFGLPRSVALLHCEAGRIRSEQLLL